MTPINSPGHSTRSASTHTPGSLIQVRFWFDTRNRQNNNYEGWFLDDVEVTTQP